MIFELINRKSYDDDDNTNNGFWFWILLWIFTRKK